MIDPQTRNLKLKILCFTFIFFFLPAVIKFEGGTDFDLQVLDDNYKKTEQATTENQNNDTTQQTDGASQPANNEANSSMQSKIWKYD